MLRPKKTIPSLIGATLALTGCGGDGGTSNPSSMTGQAFRAFCLKVGECYPNTSASDECLTYVAGYDLLAQYFSSDCDALVASYFNCFAGLTCEEFMGPEYYACIDDIDQDMVDACIDMLPQP
jgi:hypothetical protein